MKKYLQYKATDFAEDLDFIKWVQSDFTECADKWDTFMNDNPSMGDEISEAIDIIELFQFQETEVTDTQKNNLLDRINTSIDTEIASENVKVPNVEPIAKPQSIPVTKTTPAATVTEGSSKSILRYLLPLAAAACLAAFAIFNFGGAGESLKVHETSIAKTSNITMPDQSIVNLNATSTLSYDENNFSKDRKLNLDGEAFFKVEKGQRFVVETKNGSVEVLGTSFNVFSRSGLFEVECLTGKVKVTNKSGSESVLLSPNESCQLNGNKLLKKSTGLKDSEWTKGIYHFEETPLLEVIEELERQFKIAVSMTSEVENKKYTGAFEKKNLKDALHAVTWPLGLEYTINENTANANGKKGVIIKVAE